MKERKPTYGALTIVFRNSVQYFKKAGFWGVLEQIVAVLRALSFTMGIMATRDVFDAVTETEMHAIDEWHIITRLIMLAAIMIAQQILSTIGRYLLSRVSYSNMGKLMVDFQLKLGRVPAVVFENADFLNRVERAKKCVEYEKLGHFASICLQFFTYYTVLFLSLGGFLFQLSPMLPLVMLVAFVPAVIGQLTQMKVFLALEQENAPLRRQCEYYKKTLVDRSFYKETRMLGGFQYFHTLFTATLQAITTNAWRTERNVAIAKFLLSVITFLGLGVSIFILFQATMSGDISVGAFASVFAALSQIFSIMDEIVSTCLSEGSETVAQVANFYRLMDLDEVGGEMTFSNDMNGIVADTISFTYQGADKAALRNVSLSIKKGETIAIVGENGSGKSTLVKNLIGLYTPSAGNVLIGGQDTKTTHPNALYSSISGVFQNFQRYKMTLAENVAISDTAHIQTLTAYIDRFRKLSFRMLLHPYIQCFRLNLMV